MISDASFCPCGYAQEEQKGRKQAEERVQERDAQLQAAMQKLQQQTQDRCPQCPLFGRMRLLTCLHLLVRQG